MASDLAAIRRELTVCLERARAFADRTSETTWGARPAADEWSVAECLTHLNLTSRAFLPPIDEALARSPAGVARRRCRMDLTGRLLWLALSVNVPVKTTERFVPAPSEPRTTVLAEFAALQSELLARVDRAEGLDVSTQRIVSPFDRRLTYNVCSCLRIIAAHQRQHLRQAERALAAVER